jgi:hypothetical protein
MLIDWLTLRIKLDAGLGNILYERILGCMGYTLCFDSDFKEKWRKHALDIDKLRSDSQGLYWSITADGQGQPPNVSLQSCAYVLVDGVTAFNFQQAAVPFDYALATAFWVFAFSTTIAFWFLAKNLDLIISAIKRG